MVQFSHLYMTPGKTIALTKWTFVSKVMSLVSHTLSRFIIDNDIQCDSSSQACHMMYSAYKLNKQDDNIQP